jgi:hypothetical protein
LNVVFRLFTPKGWHNKAQGAALGKAPINGEAPTGRNKCHRPVGAIEMRWSKPRALPWALLFHPFGVKSSA